MSNNKHHWTKAENLVVKAEEAAGVSEADAQADVLGIDADTGRGPTMAEAQVYAANFSADGGADTCADDSDPDSDPEATLEAMLGSE